MRKVSNIHTENSSPSLICLPTAKPDQVSLPASDIPREYGPKSVNDPDFRSSTAIQGLQTLTSASQAAAIPTTKERQAVRAPPKHHLLAKNNG